MRIKKLSVILVASAMMLVGCGGADPAPSHEHVWGDPTYSWSSDNYTCTAERVCQLDVSHIEKEVAYSSFSVVNYPTETAQGLGRYVASFENSAFTTQSKDVAIPPIGSITTFEDAVSSVRNLHNYSAHLSNQFEGEEEKFADFNYYNIYDGALYSDLNGYYSGYIKQKGQGIVTFRMPLDSSGILTGSFVATNLQRGVSDYYNANIEYLVGAEQILAKEYTYDAEKGAYVCTDWDAIAMIATMAFGFSTEASAIAPEYFTAKYSEGSGIVIEADFRVVYFDEQEVDITAHVSLTVNSLGSTHNSRVEAYVANPDYTYVAPTEWNSGIKACFDDRYNSYYPPFINNLSYSWDYYYAWNEGYGAIVVEDYFSGDLVSSYINTLVAEGFTVATNPYYTEYRKVVEDELLKHTYSIKMKYHAPDEIDAGGIRYSYLYPNGLTTFIFLHKQQTKSQITTVELLNQYISNTAAGGFMPAFSLSNDTRVANFADVTSTEAEVYAFKSSGIEGSGSNYFRVYPESKAVAISFFNKLKEDLAAVGMNTVQPAFDQQWISDDYGSVVRITDPNNISSWTANSYLQVRIEITKKSIEEFNKEIIYIDYLTVSNQTTTFAVGGTFEFDGKVDVTYTDGTVVENVTPTEVIGPDMSVAGPQTVIVKYTDSEGRYGATNYTVTVNPSESDYNISVIQPTGATITVTMPTSMVQKAGQSVTFKVIPEDGYVVRSVSVICDGKEVEVGDENPITHTRLFLMPAGDVTISAVVAAESSLHSISYRVFDASTMAELTYSDVISTTAVLPTDAAANSVVNFSAITKTGYAFASAEVGESSFDSSSFSYQMGDSDITVFIYVIVEGGGGGGEDPEVLFAFTMDVSGCYWKLSFKDDGTGEYTKTRKSTSVVEATATFKYTYNESTGAVSMTEIKCDPTDWGVYRLTTVSDGTGTNNTGVISGDTLTISLKNSSGVATQYAFTK